MLSQAPHTWNFTCHLCFCTRGFMPCLAAPLTLPWH